MSLWTLLPVKPFAEAKLRLAAELSPAARAELAARLFERTLTVARQFAGGRPLLVVTRSQEIAARAAAAGAMALLEDGAGGLNAALRQAIGHALRGGASQVLSVATDLPLLTRADLEALQQAAEGGSALAPDRHGRGTNALLQQASADPVCAFGAGSFERHCAALGARGSVATVERRGLALDLDLPADLDALGRAAAILQSLELAPERRPAREAAACPQT